jgi:hypothetical protein
MSESKWKARLGPVASECTVGLCACTPRAITPTASRHQQQRRRRLSRVVDRARTAQQRRYNERTARHLLGREHNRWIVCFPTSRPSIHRCRSEIKADRLSGRLAGSAVDFIFPLKFMWRKFAILLLKEESQGTCSKEIAIFRRKKNEITNIFGGFGRFLASFCWNRHI